MRVSHFGLSGVQPRGAAARPALRALDLRLVSDPWATAVAKRSPPSRTPRGWRPWPCSWGGRTMAGTGASPAVGARALAGLAATPRLHTPHPRPRAERPGDAGAEALAALKDAAVPAHPPPGLANNGVGDRGAQALVALTEGPSLRALSPGPRAEPRRRPRRPGLGRGARRAAAAGPAPPPREDPRRGRRPGGPRGARGRPPAAQPRARLPGQWTGRR